MVFKKLIYGIFIFGLANVSRTEDNINRLLNAEKEPTIPLSKPINLESEPEILD